MNELRSKLGKVLKEEKEKLGYSYNYIHEQTGIPITSLRYIFNSNGSVGMDVYNRLLVFFGKDVDIYLIDNID